MVTTTLGYRFIVTGRVQGVGFRYATQECAAKLGVAGWVRNLPTGDVEVHAVADKVGMGAFEAWLQKGPRMARVSGIARHPLDDQAAVALVTAFAIR